MFKGIFSYRHSNNSRQQKEEEEEMQEQLVITVVTTPEEEEEDFEKTTAVETQCTWILDDVIVDTIAKYCDLRTLLKFSVCNRTARRMITRSFVWNDIVVREGRIGSFHKYSIRYGNDNILNCVAFSEQENLDDLPPMNLVVSHIHMTRRMAREKESRKKNTRTYRIVVVLAGLALIIFLFILTSLFVLAKIVITYNIQKK